MRSCYSLLLFAVVLFAGCKETATSGPSSADPGPDAEKSDVAMKLHGDDLGWLVENSTLIFLGRLSSKEVRKDSRGLIVTDHRFRIEQIVVGAFAKNEITLTTLGGTIDDRTLRVSHLPVFDVGAEYIIFTDPMRTTYDPITGNQHGVFRLGPETRVHGYGGFGLTEVRDGVLQLSGPRLREESGDDHPPTPVADDPITKGDVLSVERADLRAQEVLTVEEFIKIVQGLSPNKEKR